MVSKAGDFVLDIEAGNVCIFPTSRVSGPSIILCSPRAVY